MKLPDFLSTECGIVDLNQNDTGRATVFTWRLSAFILSTVEMGVEKNGEKLFVLPIKKTPSISERGLVFITCFFS